jgi:multidrug transporter EmrE-like cation transporter
MKQVIGYIMALAGIAFLALSFEGVKKATGFTMPVGLTGTVLTGIGILFIGLSMIFLFKSNNSKQPSEVPIYHGKNVVGYRRTGK